MVKKIAQPYRKSRAPYGARGLKYLWGVTDLAAQMSRPVWGAWIEIGRRGGIRWAGRSRPVWGAWIEISKGYKAQPVIGAVAPRMGRVD